MKIVVAFMVLISVAAASAQTKTAVYENIKQYTKSNSDNGGWKAPGKSTVIKKK